MSVFDDGTDLAQQQPPGVVVQAGLAAAVSAVTLPPETETDESPEG